MSKSDPFYLVGIGFSAGGLKPLLELFDALPPCLNAAFLIAGHLLPGKRSELTNIVQRHTSMPVAWAADGQLVMKNHVYVLPESRMLTFKNGILHVRQRKNEELINKAADVFVIFADYAQHAVVIIAHGGEEAGYFNFGGSKIRVKAG